MRISTEKDCFNIATKRIATKRIATKGIATKRIATKGIATKGIATKGIAFPDLCDLSELCEKPCFTKFVITRLQNWSPDMILTAFDRKFLEKKDEIPPGACRPLKKMKQKMCSKWTTNKLRNKNNVEKVDTQKVEKHNVEKVRS